MSAGRRWFGTDGIRGAANAEPMTPEFVLRLGQVFGARLHAEATNARPVVVVGRDTRISGGMLESALAAGLSSAGVDVLLAGVVPTPAVPVLVRERQAVAGIVVSASHNPFADNGIKIFDRDGYKLDDSVEAEIEAQLESLVSTDGQREDRMVGLVSAGTIGRIASLDDADARYLAFLRASLTVPLSLVGCRIVIDAAHGAAYRVGPEILRGFGAEVVALGADPDGVNINDECGAVHPEFAAERVRALGADLGLVLDGDADRLILIDENGLSLDGDEFLAIVAAHRPDWIGSEVVGTVMSNIGLEIALRERGISLARAAVGDRYVLERMRAAGGRVGGEPSGHLIFLDAATTGDALLAALRMLTIMSETGQPLSSLREAMTRAPQIIVNVRVARRVALETVPAVVEVLADVGRLVDGRGRVLVRFSGTEPLVRVMVEGPDAAETCTLAERIATVVRAELGE